MAGFLNLSTTDIQGWVIIYLGKLDIVDCLATSLASTHWMLQTLTNVPGGQNRSQLRRAAPWGGRSPGKKALGRRVVLCWKAGWSLVAGALLLLCTFPAGQSLPQPWGGGNSQAVAPEASLTCGNLQAPPGGDAALKAPASLLSTTAVIEGKRMGNCDLLPRPKPPRRHTLAKYGVRCP